MGPAIATSILLNSELKQQFDLLHLDTRINESVGAMGKASFGKVFRSLKLYARYIDLLRRERPDLVLLPIAQTTMGFLKDAVFLKWGWLFGRKMVVHLRGSDLKNWLDRSNVFTRWMYRFWVKKAKGAIVLGEGLRYLFAPEFPEDRIFVVPNGVDLEIPKRERGENVQILYLSNFLPGKGSLHLFEALNLLEDEFVGRVELFAAGSWDDETYEAKCRAQIAQCPVKIELSAPISGESKWNALASADIFVFPPVAPEGLPWALIEAAAAGLPIISTDQGAIKDVVQHGRSGFIVQPGSAEAIAEKLKLLIKDAALRQQMGEASRERYEEGFTEARMVAQMAACFHELIEN